MKSLNRVAFFVGGNNMPSRPLKSCSRIGCRELTNERFCEAHNKQERQRADKQRGTSSSRGYDARWRKARISYLKRYPLCNYCKDEGYTKQASVVDHIIPHKGDSDLFWNVDNWQSLCARHHNIKTATEDGAFGRKSYE